MSAKANLQEGLKRLLHPRHIAVFGGRFAEIVIRECRRIGFAGEIWPVSATRDSLGGLACFKSVADLPQAPDAAFLALPAEANLDIVKALAARGAGGVVCYASGFAEEGAEGAALQRQLVAAAGTMPIVGPNCYGVLNLLEGAVLWPDVHGAKRCARGVAILTQSGNIALNLTMQQRGLPLATVIAMGNKANGDHGDYIEALLDDPRITAIGIHCEGLDDVAGFSRAAAAALARNVPLVILKTGRSSLGAHLAMSHTSSLAGPDKLYDALFARYGVSRVDDLEEFVETLKFLHCFGDLPDNSLTSMSCSGGEAALAADLAQDLKLSFSPFPAPQAATLATTLGPKVHVANPLDYHTYIWGNLEQTTACFTAVLQAGAAVNLLILDMPREDRGLSPDQGFAIARQALITAQKATGARAAIVASLSENMPEAAAEHLLESGIAPMQGLSLTLKSIAHAVNFGKAKARNAATLLTPPKPAPKRTVLLPEGEAKALLAPYGFPVPQGEITTAAQAPALAARLGFPVCVKISSATIAHKSDVGGVALNLTSEHEVKAAVASMAHLGEAFLVEKMLPRPLAELIIGITRDPQFGLALTIGAGGILVELLDDAQTLLLPASAQDINRALQALRCFPLLNGFRGQSKADVAAIVAAVESLARFVLEHDSELQEIEINPLFILPQGCIAADLLLRMETKS